MDLVNFMGASAQRTRTEQTIVLSNGRALRLVRDSDFPLNLNHPKGHTVNSIVYIVGAVVIILAILGFLGLR